jgi:HEAT repeat protein
MNHTVKFRLTFLLAATLAGGYAGGVSGAGETPPPATVDRRTVAGERWLPALKDDRPKVRAKAAEMIGDLLRDDRAIAPLAAALDDPDPRVREAAQRAMEGRGGNRAAHASVVALANPNPETRAAAARRLLSLAGSADLRDDVPLLAAAARTGDPRVRVAAVYALGRLRDPRATEALIAAAQSEDSEVRRRAVECLAENEDPRGRALVVEALKDKDGGVRAVAVSGLWKVQDPQALERAVAALGDKDENVRRFAARALGRSGDDRVVAPLMETLKDPAQPVRAAAAVELERLTSPPGAKPFSSGGPTPKKPIALLPGVEVRLADCFADLLADEDSDIYGAAALFLIKHPTPRCVPQAIAAMEKGPTIWVRAGALGVLAALNDPRALGPLVACLGDDEWMVRDGARAALLKYPVEKVVEALRAAPGKEQPRMRSQSTALLLKFGHPLALDWILEDLKSADAKVRLAAVRAADEAPDDPRLLEPLLAATGDAAPELRCAAVSRLARLPGDHAAAAVAALAQDKAAEVRLAVVRSLGKSSDPKVLPLLAGAMADADERVRAMALRSLGSFQGKGGQEVLAPLVKGPVGPARRAAIAAMYQPGRPHALDDVAADLKDADPAVIRMAVDELGRRGDPQAVPHLERVLENRNFDLHAAVLRALEKLGRPPKDDEERAWLLLAGGKWSEALRLAPANLGAVIAALHGAPETERAQDNNFPIFFMRALICFADDGAALKAGLADPSGTVRAIFAWALGRGRDPAALPLLLTLLKDGEVGVQEAAAESLGYLADPKAVPALAEAALKGPPQVGYEAVQALGWIHDDQVLPILVSILQNAGADVRAQAAQALGDLGDPRAIGPLTDALKHYHAGVVRTAREALGKLGHPVAEPTP